MKWAVSQAVPFRRMHIRGNIVLHQDNGWASGGWMSDDLIDGNVGAGPQQQWISRNTEWGSWTGANWNMVFVGAVNPPAGEWPNPPYTKIAQVPIVREKPFLEVDASGKYSVRIPALRTNSAGITWRAGSTPGKSIPLSEFFRQYPDSAYWFEDKPGLKIVLPANRGRCLVQPIGRQLLPEGGVERVDAKPARDRRRVVPGGTWVRSARCRMDRPAPEG